ncbi:hypothetical protein DNTS_034750 [Danionella cerebrum]|uniref:Uncharacterized protein n=1 Tax=Danionella cerebrum TaxID=2873325 RepID=A0A553RF10_9TELE|nr:hypothetical protein DNTS_034750 [Danionella translucida]
MVGKIKRIRQKLHHGAVKLENEPENRDALRNLDKIQFQSTRTDLNPVETPLPDSTIRNNSKASSFPVGVFAATKISPESLVQTLKVADASNVIESKQSAAEPKGIGEKKQQSKKEKMKERRERWLNKISAVKLAREQHAADKRRKATPVVGDMRPLADALPELHELESGTLSYTTITETPVKKKPETTDFALMKPAQKRKQLDADVSFFSEALKNPAFKKNPLAVIGDHLRKRLKQEDEQS